MKKEIARRQSLTDALEVFLEANPHVWFTMREFAEVGGFGGWRTRISECVRFRGMNIVWNGKSGAASRHMYKPDSLGREASTFVAGNPETGTLFDTWPSGWQR